MKSEFCKKKFGSIITLKNYICDYFYNFYSKNICFSDHLSHWFSWNVDCDSPKSPTKAYPIARAPSDSPQLSTTVPDDSLSQQLTRYLKILIFVFRVFHDVHGHYISLINHAACCEWFVANSSSSSKSNMISEINLDIPGYPKKLEISNSKIYF